MEYNEELAFVLNAPSSLCGDVLRNSREATEPNPCVYRHQPQNASISIGDVKNVSQFCALEYSCSILAKHPIWKYLPDETSSWFEFVFFSSSGAGSHIEAGMRRSNSHRHLIKTDLNALHSFRETFCFREMTRPSAYGGRTSGLTRPSWVPSSCCW